ncbi:MAG: hypothetical protein IKX24_10850 [Prevotella sp.]|nr:hypothetical protein [Prevotella sp.]MBR5062620.1 hypothetical protein [Prevotella sp.]
MRGLILFTCMMACLSLKGQMVSQRVTAFKQFEPATVYLANGKPLTVKEANVFLKNSQLLYKNGGKVKQAAIDNVKGVDFASRTYVRIDSILAYRVGTVAQNDLYCATLIDMETFDANVRNNRQVTNFEIGSQVNLTTLDTETDDEREYPVQNRYYFLYNGKYIEAHELYVLRAVPKAKRRIFWTIVREPGFSWTQEESLMRLLKGITEGSLE